MRNITVYSGPVGKLQETFNWGTHEFAIYKGDSWSLTLVCINKFNHLVFRTKADLKEFIQNGDMAEAARLLIQKDKKMFSKEVSNERFL